MESVHALGGKLIFQSNYGSLFHWSEYLIFGAVLLASLGIGVFYGFFNKTKQTNEEFLMAGRSMSVFPVTLSLVCSFVSAITLLGEPLEVYFYGLVYIYFATAFFPMTLAVAFLYLPVFWKLQLTSAYQYFELRFNKKTRNIISIAAIIHLIIYMPVVVLGPSLAIDQVAGINKYWSSAIIFLICIIYSSIGGLKAVLWSDALQAVVMFGTIITVIVLGVSELGGFEILWQRAADSQRTKILNFDPDPRTRHTFWTGTIAAFFSWLPLFAGTQAQIQRYLSVPTINDARKCLFFNMIGLFCVITMTSLLGLLIYATFYKCDPVSLDDQVLSSSDQLLPLFVMDVLGKYRGIPGLLVSGLTCGSLSSVSSALNALPAIIIEDYIKPRRTDLTSQQLGNLSKIISAVSGLVSFALLFVIANLGNILPFTSLLHGTFLGPIVALFSLGMFFPFTNALGSMLGVIPALSITLFIGIGSIMAGNEGDLPNQKLPLSIEGCYINDTTTSMDYILGAEREFQFNTSPFNVPPVSLYESLAFKSNSWKEETPSVLIYIFSIAYLWQPAITIISSILFGLLFSLILNATIYNKKDPVNRIHEKYLSPVFLSMWIKLLGKDKVREWVAFEIDDFQFHKCRESCVL